MAGSRTMPLTPRLIMFSIAANWVAVSPAVCELAVMVSKPFFLACATAASMSLPKNGLDNCCSTMPISGASWADAMGTTATIGAIASRAVKATEAFNLFCMVSSNSLKSCGPGRPPRRP